MRLVYLLHKRSKYISEFDDIIKRRKMVRQYIQDKPIPQEIVNKLVTKRNMMYNREQNIGIFVTCNKVEKLSTEMRLDS
jgi:hypothetical protein